MTIASRHMPALRRRMIVHIGLMVLCSLLIGAGAIVGINGLHQDMGVTVQGYRQLRQLYEVGFELAIARDALSASLPDPAKALAALETADIRLDPNYYDTAGQPGATWLDESKRQECRAPILLAISLLQSSQGNIPSKDGSGLSPINDALGKVAMLSAQIRTTIVSREELADQRRHLTLLLILALSIAVVVGAVFVGIRQYRRVVNPLDRLGRGVRRFAAGHLAERIKPETDREFAALAVDFNNMAAELESLCRDLEQKVRSKSRELAQSQRLASVGFLAAGVAHEINNPLSVITGYAERCLRLLDGTVSPATLEKTRSTIGIICEEAFRCKEITDRLLSLARPGADNPAPISLHSLAQAVVRNLSGLPEYSSRRITLESAEDADTTILANDGEMKQVLLNLLLNALEAVNPNGGSVNVRVSRVQGEIELCVADDGCGMSRTTAERAFEPFFTGKHGERPGMGLGLSITHAIVMRHGGSIRAESEGAGHGSQFVVRLPAAREALA